jgi:ribosomal protein L13
MIKKIEPKWIHLVIKQFRLTKPLINKEWVIVDAENMVLGSLASKVAKILRGKYKPELLRMLIAVIM